MKLGNEIKDRDKVRADLEQGRVTAREALLTRLDNTKKASGLESLLYASGHPGNPTEVRCKITGVWLHGLVEGDEIIRKTKQGHREIHIKPLIRAYNASAAHMMITFDDQSRHQTIIDKQVFNILRSMPAADQLDLLEFIYLSDVAQWLDEESRGFGKLSDLALMKRLPVAWEEEPL